MFEGRLQLEDLTQGLSSNILACLGGGVLAGFLARGLREPAERAMGHVSRDKLLDLTDLEQPLLKKMAAEAPGSWEHARAMANLAEASAAAIHADALLTRVGAYYHDLGKTVQPKYFVENLQPGESSPHQDLEPDVSADAIMTHVVMGAKILRNGGIPEPVVEFCYTHHGTQVVEFFWHKCNEQGNPKGLTQEHFRYPGMKPQTKETAILMLVDSIEAASRTIWPPEQKKFRRDGPAGDVHQAPVGPARRLGPDDRGLAHHDGADGLDAGEHVPRSDQVPVAARGRAARRRRRAAAPSRTCGCRGARSLLRRRPSPCRARGRREERGRRRRAGRGRERASRARPAHPGADSAADAEAESESGER